MNHQDAHRLLGDYFDAELGEAEARALEKHLTECAECRAELVAFEALRGEAARLPRSIEPTRDLWPDINRALDRRLRDRSLWSLRYPLAAAAVLLIAISSTLTLLLYRGPEQARPEMTDLSGPALPADALLTSQWRAVEEEYLRATAELQDALESARPELPPATIELIERNLRIIDAAIQESRSALAADPANRDIVQLLAAGYEKKLELLRYASRVATEL
ncbi:MAG: zf-HC2 domain-containing protein [Gemmatimonadales bacterium]|jgi:anti-sigma factor RsiW